MANFASCAASQRSEEQGGQNFGRHTELRWEGLELSQSFLLSLFFGRDCFLETKVSDKVPRF